ncbi:MAG TPA: TetR/AcrR family transcriptional regulator [Baekduia sp.]|nr:TetR/AcrR family transcriptional regulator [Baekduia sp.]
MTAPALLPDADASFRGRLLAGMAAAIREHGFQATTVAEVVRRARTSRRTFYQHFEDREACFLALFDLVSEQVLAVITEAATGEDAWERRVDRTLAAYLAALAAEPELTRSCLAELPALGPEGIARARAMDERAARQLSRLVEEARVHDPELRPLTPEAALVLTGGFRELVLWTLDQGRDLTELQAVAGDLVRRITMNP